MSIEAMKLVWDYSQSTGNDRNVMVLLANFYSEKEGAWPSHTTLADKANISEATVKRCIRNLIQMGELVKDVQSGPSNSQYKTNRYWITIQKPEDISGGSNRANEDTQGGQIGHSGGSNDAIRGVTIDLQNKYLNKIETKETFESFWAIYPRRIAKGQAEKAWAKLSPNPDLVSAILEAIESFDWAKDERFIPYPATWLNARRWEDEKPADDEWVATF